MTTRADEIEEEYAHSAVSEKVLPVEISKVWRVGEKERKERGKKKKRRRRARTRKKKKKNFSSFFPSSSSLLLSPTS